MDDKRTKPSPGDSRRGFLKKSAAATAAVAATGLVKTPVYGQSQAPSTGRVIGANDRIAVAIVGVGVGIGKNHLEGIHQNAAANNVVVAAACDLFNKRRDWAQEKAGLKSADVFQDYRRLLERNDIDAVLIATHDPWHAPIAIDSLITGKHVYCEKPLTRYLDEAFRIHDTVKKTGKIFTLGSQGCSAAGWHKAAEIIQSGTLGPLVWAHGSYCRNNPKGEWNYEVEKETAPENVDWDVWLGPVSKRPFSAEAFHRWRKYYPYCGGLLGDLVPHRLLPLMVATGKPEFPTRVVSIGTKNVHTDRKKPAPERDVPEHVQLTAEFPSGYMITISSSSVNARSPGFSVYGHQATLEIGNLGERILLIPEKDFTEEIDAEEVKGLQFEDIRFHEKNWFDCIRSGKAPNANIDLAIRAQTVISLAEMAERMKITCLFDEKTRRVTDGTGKEIPLLTYGSIKGQS